MIPVVPTARRSRHIAEDIPLRRKVIETMWLPKKIYERMPHYWLLLGMSFMSAGLFFGFDYPMAKYYFGTGIVCCLFSMAVFSARLRHRNAPDDDAVESAAPAADSGPDQDLPT